MTGSAPTGMDSAVAPTRASYRWKVRQCLRNGKRSAPERCRPDLNRGGELCRPVPNRSATAPGALRAYPGRTRGITVVYALLLAGVVAHTAGVWGDAAFLIMFGGAGCVAVYRKARG